MLYGHKSPTRKSNKKIIKRKSASNNVRVVKHFQPGTIYHNTTIGQRDFPDVNSDFDVIQSLNTIKKVESYSQKEVRGSKNVPYQNRLSKNKVPSKNTVTEKKTVKTIYSSIRSPEKQQLKSKSCVEERDSKYNDENENLKSKSFVDILTKKSGFTSDSNSLNSENSIHFYTSIDETPLDKLKKDIIINRIEGFRSFLTCPARKEKIENLRKEISNLINQPSGDRIMHENVNFEKYMLSPNHGDSLVYNVNETSKYVDNEKTVEANGFKKKEILNVSVNENNQPEAKETQSKYSLENFAISYIMRVKYV